MASTQAIDQEHSETTETMTQKQFERTLKYAQEEWDSRAPAYADLIPDYTMESLREYLLEGTPVGGFLQAVLENDLFQAVGRADSENLRAFGRIVALIYNVFPMPARDYEEWLIMHNQELIEEAVGFPSNTPARDCRGEHDPTL